MQKEKKFDFNLESLRGVAALVVCWAHTTGPHGLIDPHYYPTGVASWPGPAHLAVLVFFLLYGYVIELTQPVALKKDDITLYLKKRFLRIYPIYFLCLVLALITAKNAYPISTVISYLFVTQGWLSQTIPEIEPSWSLSYEAIFYLLFVPISFFRINPVPVALLCLAVGCGAAYFYPVHTNYSLVLISSYCFGFTFWLAGAIIARYFRDKPAPVSYAQILSVLFLMLAVGTLDAPVTFFNRLALAIFGKDMNAQPVDHPGILLRDFGYLPYCAIILLVFTSKRIRFRNLLLLFLLALPAFTYYYYYRHFNQQTLALLTLPTLFYSLAILLFVLARFIEPIAEAAIQWLIPTGAFSFGLYIVHYPLLHLFNKIQPFSGSATTFFIRMLCFAAITIMGARFLELKFQPWIRKKFFPK